MTDPKDYKSRYDISSLYRKSVDDMHKRHEEDHRRARQLFESEGNSRLGKGEGEGEGKGEGDAMNASMEAFNKIQGEQSMLQSAAERAVGSYFSGYIASRGFRISKEAMKEIESIAAANIPFVSTLAQGFLSHQMGAAFDELAHVLSKKPSTKQVKNGRTLKVIEGGMGKGKGGGEGEGEGTKS